MGADTSVVEKKKKSNATGTEKRTGKHKDMEKGEGSIEHYNGPAGDGDLLALKECSFQFTGPGIKENRRSPCEKWNNGIIVALPVPSQKWITVLAVPLHFNCANVPLSTMSSFPNSFALIHLFVRSFTHSHTDDVWKSEAGFRSSNIRAVPPMIPELEATFL